MVALQTHPFGSRITTTAAPNLNSPDLRHPGCCHHLPPPFAATATATIAGVSAGSQHEADPLAAEDAAAASSGELYNSDDKASFASGGSQFELSSEGGLIWHAQVRRCSGPTAAAAAAAAAAAKSPPPPPPPPPPPLPSNHHHHLYHG